MKSLWTVSYLLYKNNVDQLGRSSYFLKTCPFAIMNILLLSFLFATTHQKEMSLVTLVNQYVYFIPLLALSAGVASWEVDLMAGTSELLIIGDRALGLSRLLVILSELACPILFYFGLMLWQGANFLEYVNLLILAGAFSYFGVAFGLLIGFKNEKSINNVLHLMVWVLGFGPGPFFGESVETYQFFFPGAQSLQGHFALEWTKIAVYVLVAGVMMFYARKPRSYRFYTK